MRSSVPGTRIRREYATDPLEILFVREVMRTNVVALPAATRIDDLAASLRNGESDSRGQRLYPVLDENGGLSGVLTRNDVQGLLAARSSIEHPNRLNETVKSDVVVAYPDEPLRAVMYRMAETGLTRFPVVERESGRRLQGMIGLRDMLKATQRHLEEERHRERVLRTHLLRPFRRSHSPD